MDTEKTRIELIQQSINKKADIRAIKFIDNLIKTIKDSGLLEIKGFQVADAENDYCQSMRASFWSITSSDKSPISKLYKIKYDEFVIEETKDFVRKVDELGDQINELLSNINNQ